MAIKFTEKDDGRQFITVHIKGSIPTEEVYSRLKGHIPSIDSMNKIMDEEEILLEMGSGEGDFSLKDLQAAVTQIVDARVGYFTVDIEEENQRYLPHYLNAE